MGFVTTIDHLNGHDDIALALGNMIVAWSGAEAMLVHAMASVGNLEIHQATSGFSVSQHSRRG